MLFFTDLELKEVLCVNEEIMKLKEYFVKHV